MNPYIRKKSMFSDDFLWSIGSAVLLGILIAGVPLAAQNGIEIRGTTPTQALIEYTAPAADVPCWIEVSEKEDFSELVHDVNPALFANANLDTQRTLVADSAFRRVVLGRRTSEPSNGRFYSRALGSAQRHYLRVTCGAQVMQTTFYTTATAGVVPDPLPFHPAAHGNMAVPDFDWSDRNAPVIDPQTGVKIRRIGDPRDFASNTSHNFPALLGGEGWSNLTNALSGTVSSLATTSATNPVLFIVDSSLALANGGYSNTSTQSHPITAMAIRLFGQGSDSDEVNRAVSVCITVDSGQSCHTDWVDAVLPSGGAADAGLVPSSYPNPLFAGWSRVVPREYFTSSGFVTANGGVVTLIKDNDGSPINFFFHSARSRFHQEWRPGSRIFIQNSAPTCPNNYCTLESVNTMLELKVAENLTLTAEQRYRFAGLGFLVAKKTGQGTISLSASVRLAKSFILHQGDANSCGSAPVTTSVDRFGVPLSPPGRTIKGYLCLFPFQRESGGRLYFVGSSEPETRLLSLLKQPTAIAGYPTVDLPNGLAEIASPNGATFETDNPNVFYHGLVTQGGGFSLFRYTYEGDYRENSAAFWNSNINTTPAVGTDNVRWENLTRASQGRDLRTQILNSNLGYSEAVWGNLSQKLVLSGFTRTHAILYTQPVGGRETPCWVFAVELRTGNLVRGWNTLNGGGVGALAGSCHNITTAAERILLSNNGLKSGSTTALWGGPFETSVVAVMRNGAYTSNTQLPAAADGSYDATCPAGLNPQWVEMGAVPGSNQCVTVIVASEPCSVSATANEKVLTPCPSDPNQSWVGAPMGEGQQFYDGGRFHDDEHLLIVRRRDLPEGIELVLLRDAAPGYCCQVNNARGRLCLASPGQATHAANWKLRMVPRGSCGTVLQVYDPLTGLYVPEEQNLIRGHGNYQSLNSGNHTYVGISSFGPGYSARFDVPPSAFGTLGSSNFTNNVTFAGMNNGLSGSVQSYLSLGGADAGDFERKFTSDWRHPNGNFGVVAEAFGQSIGQPYTVTLEPGTSSVFKVSTISGNYDPKRGYLMLWAGRYILNEKSSSLLGNTLTQSDIWHFCYALRAGECREGSAAGTLYVNVPGLETSINQCHASQSSYRALCAFASSAVLGQLMQMRLDLNDPTGLWQRKLGFALTRPGSQYVYSRSYPFVDGKSITATAWNLQGVYSLPIKVDLPPWQDDSMNRTTFHRVSVQVPAGSHVEFGYEEFGAPSHMYCTPRAETCRVTAPKVDERNPFLWEAEAAAASNGSIEIPALPGRILYYRVVTSGNPGELQVRSIP